MIAVCVLVDSRGWDDVGRPGCQLISSCMWCCDPNVAVQTGLPNITETIIKRRHMLFGHVARLDATTPAHHRSWSKLLLSSPDTSPTLSGGELLDVLVTFGSCRLAMDHHWVSDGSGRRHRITVIMESRRNGPQLSSRHDDDDDVMTASL